VSDFPPGSLAHSGAQKDRVLMTHDNFWRSEKADAILTLAPGREKQLATQRLFTGSLASSAGSSKACSIWFLYSVFFPLRKRVF